MTFNTFVHYVAEYRGPAAILNTVRREGVARYKDRVQAGRADSVLTFDDLIQRLENALAV